VKSWPNDASPFVFIRFFIFYNKFGIPPFYVAVKVTRITSTFYRQDKPDSTVGGYFVETLIKICILFYCGSIGDEIAMKYKGYQSIEETKRKEKVWNIIGMIIGVLYVILLVFSLIAIFS
jgi:hypothetical protein